MDRNLCWYCNKELVEPSITYSVMQRRRKERKILSVHSDCYKSLVKGDTKHRLIISGVLDDGS